MNTPSAETNSPSPPRTNYMAYVGWVIAIAGGVSFVAFAYRTVIDVKHDEECQANLKRIGAAL